MVEVKKSPYLTVSEFAHYFRVSRHTVYKLLSLDHPDEAVIPRSMWVRSSVRSGHIRIHRDAIRMVEPASHSQGFL